MNSIHCDSIFLEYIFLFVDINNQLSQVFLKVKLGITKNYATKAKSIEIAIMPG